MYSDPSEASIGQLILLTCIDSLRGLTGVQSILGPKVQALPLNVVYDCGNIERYLEGRQSVVSRY